jgi:protein-tyrosine phosphatase
MLDLHCHILPGVDDGPTLVAESLAIARFCVRDGITHVVATPHCHRQIHLLREAILPHVARLNDVLKSAEIPLVILPGSEIQAFDTDLYRDEFEEGLYCHLGDSKTFTLLEFPWDGRKYPTDAPELVTWLRERGMTAIVAHPERYKFFRDDPAKMRALADAGAWFQVTVDSLLGNHGDSALALSEKILAEYPKIVLSTDTHNLGRCSGLSAGYAWVRERFGVDREADLRERSSRVLAAISPEGGTACESP